MPSWAQHRGEPPMEHLSRRQLVQGAGVAGVVLLAGCGRLPWQARPPLPRGGVVWPIPESPPTEAFRRGLHELGYVDGQNVVVDYRYTGDDSQLPALMAEMVQLKVDVIVTAGEGPVEAAKAVTSTIPIVMAVARAEHEAPGAAHGSCPRPVARRRALARGESREGARFPGDAGSGPSAGRDAALARG